ncbi:flagellar hook-length control protein FliK [Kineothrix alysoides]|uniref:Flagellar hook-length control protein FliK n=1 Tax=Kineothrix alysoides TaxID=1469948 RepID=A0A4R1QPF4_9FIRM|nr:flagellar hook-length control protein FliK [Kineothrix alysoides]TCL55689.1 flagellar hook-length control protein FliK [Kineothrix alysoides]
MNLAGLFQPQYGNKGSGSRSGSVRAPISVTASGNYQTQQVIKNLSPGQTIQGEIVNRNGNEVQIRVDKDVIITARLDKDISLAVGQNVTFEVKNQSGQQLALRPLYENLSQNPNVLKALEAAKLPLTDELMRMVSSMMEQGMSIDKNALLDMGKLISAHSGVNPETIVGLRSLYLPVTPENIEQFENYQNYRHQIVSSVTEFLSELPSAFQTMVAQGQAEGAVNFYKQVLQLFAESSMQGETQNAMQNAVQNNEAGKVIFADAGRPAGGMQEEAQAAGKESVLNAAQNQAEGRMTESIIRIIDGEGDAKAVNADGTAVGKGADTMASQERVSAQGGNLQNYTPLFEVLNQDARNTLFNLLEGIGFSKQQLSQVADGSMPVKQLLQDINTMLTVNAEAVSRESVINLFGSRVYNQLLNNEVLQQWLLKPSDVGQKNTVEDFYGKLREQSARLTEALGQISKDIPLAKNLSTMQSNIEFMNQLNQAFNYIQLPLKMSGGNAHGDLYVYTNRRNAPKEDESVSALLHLDMQHLGTMDIYVKMKEKNVSTKFYLKDEQTIDFIADHIHILNERLSERGYTMNVEMVMSKEEEKGMDVMETMSAQEKRENILAQYSFDVRA